MIRIPALAAATCLLTGMAGAASAQQSLAVSVQDRPWMNISLSPDARADLVQAQMTEDEERQLVIGYFGAITKLAFIKPAPAALQPKLLGTAGYVPGIERLGIPALIESDAGGGVANSGNMRPGDQATALPSGIAQAATWNADTAFAVGATIGTEVRNRGFNVLLGGAINLAREPRGGRTFEYAGEDPLLAGTIIGETVRGTQSRHVISTTKHYALNDQETGRNIVSADIGEGPMRESDLLAFEIAIEHGNPGAVMCAYNRINGKYACENDFLLNRVLKHDWGYPGWVLSDWGAVHSTAESANAGLDQESASGFDRTEFFGAPLKKALDEGAVPKARLHDMVHRILRTMFANGLVDDPPVTRPTDFVASLAVAQHAAEQSMVLLKNANGLLPLAANTRSIALIGTHADIGMLGGGGSSQVAPIGHRHENEYPVGGSVWVLWNGARIPPLATEIFAPPSPLAALKARLPNTVVRYDNGDIVANAAKLAQSSDVAIVFARQWMSEGDDVRSLALSGQQDALIEAVAAANPRTIVVLETGGPVLMPWLDKVPAVLEAWYAGSGGSQALARILMGDVDPSGRLPITFPQSEAQLPRPVLPGIDVQKFWDLDYIEGADVGYRWFARQKQTPLFPFGHGLSYSHFRIDNLKAGGDNITVDVTNDGNRDGIQTVQLYGTPPPETGTSSGAGVPRLIGFAKVELKAGETRQVTIAPEMRRLAHFDDDADLWRVAAGTYTIAAGASFLDIDATTQVTLAARDIKP